MRYSHAVHVLLKYIAHVIHMHINVCIINVEVLHILLGIGTVHAQILRSWLRIHASLVLVPYIHIYYVVDFIYMQAGYWYRTCTDIT